MGRIAAGADFGQAVAEPTRITPRTDPAAGPMALADSIGRIGAENERDAVQAKREQDAEFGMMQRRAEQEQARIEHQRAVESDQLDAAQAQARILGLRDGLADTLASIDEEVQTGRLPKDQAAAAWKERSTALISDELPNVPASRRALARVDAEGLSMRLASKVGDIVRKRDRSDALAAINGTLEYTQRLAVTDPDRARAIMEASLRGAGPAAGLMPDKIASLEQGWNERTAYTRAYSAVNAARMDNAALAAVEQAVVGNKDLDPQKQATLLAEIARFRTSNDTRALVAAQKAEVAAQKAERESKAALSWLSGVSLAGKRVDENDKATSAMIAKLTPADAEAYRVMQSDVASRTALAMRPLAEMDQYVDTLHVMAAQATTPALEAEIKRAEHVRAEARKDYSEEPLRAAQERGLLDTPLLPMRMDSVDSIFAGMATRVEQAKVATLKGGKPASPMLSREATVFSNFIRRLPIEQQSERLAQVGSMLPPEQAQALAGQIAKGHTEQDKAIAIALALGAARTTGGPDEGRPVSTLVLRGAQALRDKAIKEEKTPVDGWMGQIIKQLQGVYVNPQQADMAAQAARLVLAGLVSEGAPGSQDDAKRAVRLAVGGAIREYNGERILLPAGYEVEDLTKRLKSITPEELGLRDLGLPNGLVFIGGVPMSSADFIAALPEARLQYAGRGRYYVKAGTTYASRADGEPIVVKVAPSAR